MVTKLERDQTIRGILENPKSSAFATYRHLTAGDCGILRFLYQEIVTTLFGPVPGALGIVLRKLFYRPLFGSAGSKVVIGCSCVLRHPQRIHLGDGVVIDDSCVIDARGALDSGVRLDNGVILNRETIVISKAGDVHIGAGTSIGMRSALVSWSGIEIGRSVGMAGECAISAGTLDIASMAKPVPEREPITKGPICIGDNVWIATRVTVLDAVKIGSGCIISAGSVVTHDLDEQVVAHGNPAEEVFRGR